MTSFLDFELMTNVFPMPHSTTTSASCKDICVTLRGLSSAQSVKCLVFTFPFLETCAWLSGGICNGQLFCITHLRRKSFAYSERCYCIAGCNMWAHKKRKENIRRTVCIILIIAAFVTSKLLDSKHFLPKTMDLQ